MAFSFKKATAPTFKTEVKVPVPNGKGGHDNQTFTAIFKRTTTEQLEAMTEDRMQDKELVRDRLVDWELTDADTGESVPFSPEALEALLSISPSPRYIAQAFFESVMGGKR
jgi:hypothetical protein